MRQIPFLFFTVICGPAFAQASDFDKGYNAGYNAGFSDGIGQGMQAQRFNPSSGNQFPDCIAPEILPNFGAVDDGRFPSFGHGVLDNPLVQPWATE